MRRGYTHDRARFFFSRSSTYSSMKCEFTVNWNPPRRIFLFGTFYSTPTTVSSSIVGLYLTVDSYGHFRPFLNFGGRVFGNFACSQTRVAMPKPPSVPNPFDLTPPSPSLFFARALTTAPRTPLLRGLKAVAVALTLDSLPPCEPNSRLSSYCLETMLELV